MQTQNQPRSTGIRLAAILFVVLLAGAQLLARDLKSLTTPQELALGQTFAAAVAFQFPMLRDPVLRWYVNLRGRQLADVSEAATPVTITARSGCKKSRPTCTY